MHSAFETTFTLAPTFLLPWKSKLKMNILRLKGKELKWKCS